MAQRKQVHSRLDLDLAGEDGDGRRVDQPVEALAAAEGDMVADTQPVQPAVLRVGGKLCYSRGAPRENRCGDA